jgi:hypothetical protein
VIAGFSADDSRILVFKFSSGLIDGDFRTGELPNISEGIFGYSDGKTSLANYWLVRQLAFDSVCRRISISKYVILQFPGWYDHGFVQGKYQLTPESLYFNLYYN